jgi:hypothetical protein
VAVLDGRTWLENLTNACWGPLAGTELGRMGGLSAVMPGCTGEPGRGGRWGAWGTTVAGLVAARAATTLWASRAGVDNVEFLEARSRTYRCRTLRRRLISNA